MRGVHDDPTLWFVMGFAVGMLVIVGVWAWFGGAV